MAGLSSPGIGSGLDINSLVTQLVAAERAAPQARITREESKVTVQISGLASLKGALSGFKGALENLRTEDAFSPRAATVGDKDVFTATATSSAATGHYDVEVVSLAKAHQLASGAFASGSSAVVGTGTLTIAQGEKSFQISIDSTNNTLAGIRDAINDAEDNPGVQATLLYETGGARLVLTSNKTGEDNAIKVTQSGGDGGLNQLVYDPPTTANLTEVEPATDAHIKIAGFDHYSTTNTVSGAIDGVTLTLKSEQPGEPVSLDISYDTSTLTSRIQNFVTEYNKLYTTMKNLRSYDSSTGQSGPLLGDALLRGVEDRLRRDLSDPVNGLSGTYTTLASIGITRQTDGKLALDNTKLTAALDADRGAVAKIFGSANGIAARLYDHIGDQLVSDAALETRNTALQKSVKSIQQQKEALDARMEVIEERYRKQFSALDTLLAQLQSTSSYLASQLASLPGAG